MQFDLVVHGPKQAERLGNLLGVPPQFHEVRPEGGGDILYKLFYVTPVDQSLLGLKDLLGRLKSYSGLLMGVKLVGSLDEKKVEEALTSKKFKISFIEGLEREYELYSRKLGARQELGQKDQRLVEVFHLPYPSDCTTLLQTQLLLELAISLLDCIIKS